MKDYAAKHHIKSQNGRMHAVKGGQQWPKHVNNMCYQNGSACRLIIQEENIMLKNDGIHKKSRLKIT